MARPKFRSDEQDQFMVRMPLGMRDRIKFAAEANNRSMNAEIVATLSEAYPAPDPFQLAMREMADILTRRRLGTSLPGEYEALPDFIKRIAEDAEAEETAEERAEAIDRAKVGYSTDVQKADGGYRAPLKTPVKVRRRPKSKEDKP